MEEANADPGRVREDGDLRDRSVRGGVATMTAQGLRLGISLGSLAVLGRLLRPEDFGLVAMVVALTGFLARFKDFGLANASVQRADITHRQLSGLFWLNSLIGSLLTGSVACAGPLLAWVYDEPRLTPIALALSTSFLLGGLGIQHAAMLRRRLHFTRLAVIEVLAGTASAGTAVALALQGAGYWSLVAMPIVAAAVTSVAAWSLCDWRPGPPERDAPLGLLVAFGGRLSLVSLLNSAARSVDGFLVGWAWGAGPLGLYSKAIQLSLMAVEQLNVSVTRVAIPVLARLQRDPERFRGYYRRGIQLVASLSIPASVAFFVFADEIVRVTLGPQWDAAAPLFRILAPAALFESLRMATSWVYISLGRSRRHLRWAGIAAALRIACIAAGLPWGATGVAVGFSAGAAASWLPGVLYCFHSSPLRPSDLTRVLWRPATAAAAAGAVTWVLFGGRDAGSGSGAAWTLLTGLAAFAAAYAVAWRALPGGEAALRDLLTLGPWTHRREPTV